jgi:DNA-binding LacI/PurR family transcriptional regulator
MQVTMRHVARHAGVSVKTVSRVVNAEPHIRPEMVTRVRQAIEELGWVPSATARALRTGRTGVVGIAVSALRRPYLAGLVEALVTEVDARGLEAAVEPTGDDPRRLSALLAGRGQLYDAVVLIANAGSGPLEGLGDRPVVVVQGRRELADADGVDDDVAQGRALVARHLSVMGCTRPAVLETGSPAEGTVTPTVRALHEAGFDPARVTTVEVAAPFDRSAGASAAGRLLRSATVVDAIVCINDEVALGALGTLVTAGVKVPQDVAVVGYDNLDDGQFSTPSLTTVDPRPARLARTALDLLGARLAGTAPAGPRHITTPVDLVRRESTLGESGR